MVCANSIAGADADFIIQSSPFVHPDGKADTVLEDMTRRAILGGVIVNIATDVMDLWQTYSKWGMTNGGRYVGNPYGYMWYPGLGKSNWGRIGDALCHVSATRSGSAAVMSRNWHPGPLGHQGDQDSRVFLWADAAIMALDDVIAGLKETGGKTGPLKYGNFAFLFWAIARSLLSVHRARAHRGTCPTWCPWQPPLATTLSNHTYQPPPNAPGDMPYLVPMATTLSNHT